MENLETILTNALDCINNEDFNKAKELLEKFIQEDKDNIEAYKNLGLCEINLDNPINALCAFQKAVELDENDATSLFYLANCYSRIGEKEKAIDTLKKVIEIRPNYLDGYKNLAMFYIECANYAQAIETIKTALKNPEIEIDYSIEYIIATSYMLNKDNKNAIIHLEDGLKLYPNHPQMVNSLAVCYINEGAFKEALSVLIPYFEENKNSSISAFNIGNCFLNIGEYENAMNYFQIAYNLEPTIAILSMLAKSALLAEQNELALSLYQNLVITYPHNEQYRISYVQVLENLKKYKEALENVNFLLQTDGKNIALIKKKGTYLRKLGFHDESIKTFEILLHRGKIDVEVYYNLAFNYIEQNDFDSAKEMFKKCIILEPNNPFAHKDLGVLYLKMNCYEWAVDEILEAIKLEDDVAEFYYSLGVCYMMLSKIEEAKKCFDKSLTLEPSDANTLAYYGYIYLMEQDYKRAFELLEKAIKIEPDNFLAQVNLAKYYFALKKYDIVIKFLEDSTKVSKDDESLNMFAISCMETGRIDDACNLFEKLSLKNKESYTVLTNLAQCYYKQNEIDKAKKALTQALLAFSDYKPALDLLKEINNANK